MSKPELDGAQFADPAADMLSTDMSNSPPSNCLVAAEVSRRRASVDDPWVEVDSKRRADVRDNLA